MPTIGDLLARLHQDAWDAAAERPSPDRLECGVGMVATSATRALRLLGERRDTWEDLAHLESLVDHGVTPARGLARVATSLGAIADVLAGSHEEVRLSSAGERSRLCTHVQAAVHAVTRMALLGANPSHRPSMEAVAAATEAAALVPPNSLATTLSHLSPAGDAATQWGRVARQVLTQRASVTGYAFQRTAIDISLICRTAMRIATKQSVLSPPAETGRIGEALGAAAIAWRSAAAWPAHLRLGGRTPDLTPASTTMARELRRSDLAWVSALRAVRVAQGVAVAHADCLAHLAATHQLWIAASSRPDTRLLHLGRSGTVWVKEPDDGTDGRDIANRSAAALATLQQVFDVIGKPSPARWETVDPPSLRRDAAPTSFQPALPGVAW